MESWISQLAALSEGVFEGLGDPVMRHWMVG
jgi:hypothetical protein